MLKSSTHNFPSINIWEGPAKSKSKCICDCTSGAKANDQIRFVYLANLMRTKKICLRPGQRAKYFIYLLIYQQTAKNVLSYLRVNIKIRKKTNSRHFFTTVVKDQTIEMNMPSVWFNNYFIKLGIWKNKYLLLKYLTKLKCHHISFYISGKGVLRRLSFMKKILKFIK